MSTLKSVSRVSTLRLRDTGWPRTVGIQVNIARRFEATSMGRLDA